MEGMLKIVHPDLVLISLIGSYGSDSSLFFLLHDKYEEVPVLTIGTKEECGGFTKYYEDAQFQNLVRPIENSAIYKAICDRLAMVPDAAVAESPYPLSMEDLDQPSGYVLYRTTLAPYEQALSLRFDRAADRAQLFENGAPVATLLNEKLAEGVRRESGACGAQIDALFENAGRVNFGPQLENQRKGIAGNAIINDHIQYGWKHYRLPLDEAQDMLRKAGYALSRSNEFDIILEYFIRQGNYNVFEINEALFSFDQPLLGA